MRRKYTGSHSIILSACINWCCTKELGYFWKIKNQTKLCCFPSPTAKGISPAPTLLVLGQPPQSRPPEKVACECDLSRTRSLGRQVREQEKQDREAEVLKQGCGFRRSPQGAQSKNVNYTSELSQHLWVTGQGCRGEEVPGPLAFCSLRQVAPAALGLVLQGSLGELLRELKLIEVGVGVRDEL